MTGRGPTPQLSTPLPFPRQTSLVNPDVVVNVEDGTLDIINGDLDSALRLTPADLKVWKAECYE